MLSNRLTLPLLFLLALSLAAPASVLSEELLNDGWSDGQSLSFQGGFVAGEMGAARLVPSIAGSFTLQNVQFMFGGAATLESIVLHVWDDSAGTNDPGVELFSNTYQILGSNDFMAEIDLSGEGITVSGPIRVGIEFTHTGYPSIARDDDGSIDSSRNFIYTAGAWFPSSLFGLTGDWIIRANTAGAALFTVGGTVSGLSGSLTLQNNGGDDLVVTADGPFTFPTGLSDGAAYAVTVLSGPVGQACVVSNGSGTIAGANVTNVSVVCSGGSTILANDGFFDGGSAGFQGGFVAGEIAASRLTTPDPESWSLDGIQLLFGGSTDVQNVTLKVWADGAGTDVPGAELYSGDFALLGGDFLQQIDLTSAGLTVSGDFRVGLQFQHSGYPSVARDDDGTIATDRNFIHSGGAWYKSYLLGLTGDWVIRALVSSQQAPQPFAITSIVDLPNDQGRQVRITWPNNEHDAPGDATPVTGYALFRRIDPGLKAYPPGDWDYLTTVPAFQEATYSTIVPTVADSTIVDGMVYTTFFVRAMTASPGVYFDSAPDSGYSVDNLVPQTPQGFTVAYDGALGNALTWDECPDGDWAYFKIYRGDTADFAVDPENPYRTTTATDFVDAAGGFGDHYRISAVDFSGNESPATAASDTEVSGVDRSGLPGAVVLERIFPNPFNPAATVRFHLPEPSTVGLFVFDVAGRRVRTLLDGELVGAGSRDAIWRGLDDAGRQVAGGTYFFRLEAGGKVETRRAVLVK